jgi:hypothetical protein
MSRLVKRNGAAFRFLRQFSLGFLLVTTVLNTITGQENRSSLVRLFRLEGSFGAELAVKIDSDDRSETSGFTLRGARLEADSMGFLTRLRSVVTLANRDTTRNITEVEWRLDVYDEALRSLSQRVLQSEKVNIYPGETANAATRFGAVLPDRMVVLLQLVSVSFADGSAWSTRVDCSLGEDLRTVSCKPR